MERTGERRKADDRAPRSRTSPTTWPRSSSTRPTGRSRTRATIEVGGRDGRAALPRSRPHRPRHRHPRAGHGRRCAPATSVESGDGPVLRRRLPAGLAGDGDGPGRACRLAAVVVPGHGDHAGRAFAESQAASLRRASRPCARRVHAGELDSRRGCCGRHRAVPGEPRPALPGPSDGRCNAATGSRRAGASVTRATDIVGPPRRSAARCGRVVVSLDATPHNAGQPPTRTTQRPRAAPATIAVERRRRACRA